MEFLSFIIITIIYTRYHSLYIQSAAPGDNVVVNIVALDEFQHNTTAFLELNPIQVWHHKNYNIAIIMLYRMKVNLFYNDHRYCTLLSCRRWERIQLSSLRASCKLWLVLARWSSHI